MGLPCSHNKIPFRSDNIGPIFQQILEIRYEKFTIYKEKITLPDWIAHILITWSICTILGFRFKEFNQSNTAIAMLGSVLPDVYKITILFNLSGIKLGNMLSLLHIPIGSFIFAIILSLFFKERKNALIFLSFGIFTHYVLDLLLEMNNNGMYLLFPFCWDQWQLGIISNIDYNVTIISIIGALIVYTLSKKSSLGKYSKS